MSQPWLPGGSSTLTLPPGQKWNTPSVDSPPSGIKVWDDTAWMLKPVRAWDGTAWVIKPLKYWDGTQWALSTW